MGKKAKENSYKTLIGVYQNNNDKEDIVLSYGAETIEDKTTLCNSIIDILFQSDDFKTVWKMVNAIMKAVD